jgi:hypothetical protein
MMHIAERDLPLCVSILLALAGVTLAASPDQPNFAAPEPVEIIGYSGDAMEPFLSRDGKYLFFNNRNDPASNTDLYWARALSGGRFQFMGEVQGVNTPSLEGVPSMDRDGVFYFISPRDYQHTLSTLYRGRFANGLVTNVELVAGLATQRPGIVTFDAEISADGRTVYGVDGDLTGGRGGPRWAKIFLAVREGNGFRRLSASDRSLASVNRDELQYAPDISADGLTLYYTRVTGLLLWRKTQIMVATRTSPAAPFGPPHSIDAITGFAEAPSISSDGNTLYFHKLVGGAYRIFRVTRRQ